jgi:hypothetical protein
MRTALAIGLAPCMLIVGCGGERPAPRLDLAAPPSSPATLAAPAPHATGAAAGEGCFAPLASKNPVDQAKLDEVEARPGPDAEKRFERGRVYFAAQRYAEAGIELRTVAFRYPDSSPGIYAAELYLDCLNAIGTRVSGRPCFDEMARDVPKLTELYCRERRAAHESSCHLFEQIELDLERRTDEELAIRADKSGEPSAYRAAAEGFSQTLQERCLPAPEGSRCDEIAFNGAMAYLAAGDATAARSALAVMRDPKNRMQKSPLVTRLACRLDPASSPRCPRSAP